MTSHALLFTILLLAITNAVTINAPADPYHQQQQQQQHQNSQQDNAADQTNAVADTDDELPAARLVRPKARVNVKAWTQRLSDDISVVSQRANCRASIRRFYEKKMSGLEQLEPAKLRDSILHQINTLLSQHRAAVGNIVADAEKFAAAHHFVRTLRFNYTDVHRLRNELDPRSNLEVLAGDPVALLQMQLEAASSTSALGQPQNQYTTSINGGTPVPGPPEWQTPFKAIAMAYDKNFGDVPVNTSMSAVHVPLQIYPGLPLIMNGIAWSEKLDSVFRKNFAQYSHVHHQYYGDHRGFLRTYPAHKWRIPRNEPDLFDARSRPWYLTGATSPKDLVILVDASGSMTGLRREIAKGVVFEILDTLTNNDYFSVLRFSESVVPMGLPRCNMRVPRVGSAIIEQCANNPSSVREKFECEMFKIEKQNRGRYLKDHIEQTLNNKNGTNSYLTDEAYQKSIANVTNELTGAYLLPATGRNIRYLKSNFTLPTGGISNFTNALMAAFELLNAYNRTGELGSQCNQAIMIITDGAIASHADVFNRYNYPNAPVRVFTYMIGREVGDISHTKAMACTNRGYYTHVINLSEIREQVQKYLPVMARPIVLAKQHPVSWTNAYGDETYQVLTDWVLEAKRRERARTMLNEERDRLNETDNFYINIEQTNITEYDEISAVDEELNNRMICEERQDDLPADDELDPLGYNDLGCHWTSRRADLLISVVKPVIDPRNTTVFLDRVWHKNQWTEREIHPRNAQLLGVAAVDLRIADIARLAPTHQLGPNGYAILLGNNGFVIHHPDLRALLEDPFDIQSKILKPHFSSMDLTHIEQVYHRSEFDLKKRQAEDAKLLKMRELALRRQSGFEWLWVKRAVDCQKRIQIRQQLFYYGPIKDTPFAFILALPQQYGLNKLQAKLELNQHSATYFTPSDYDLWTVHPDYKYCQGASIGNQSNNGAILQVVKNSGDSDRIVYDDLTLIQNNTFKDSRVVCDRELFPSLLFDAAATYEKEDFVCDALPSSVGELECGDEQQSSGFSFYRPRAANTCDKSSERIRSALVNIYGVELSFISTRNGLTRVRKFDLTKRIKKLADLFIQKHNKGVEENFYSRTVDFNTRFGLDMTVVTVPYNAYVRLIAKLKQRITARHPAINDTRSNCDPSIHPEEEEEEPESGESPSADNTSTTATANVGVPTTSIISPTMEPTDSPTATIGGLSFASTLEPPKMPQANYAEFSSYDFLDLLANSSVHVSATQSIVVLGADTKQRAPVAVSGVLYDYASFARRFLNTTSLNVEILSVADDEESSGGIGAISPTQTEIRVDICPGGECPTQCGLRNDSIDCLLVDNNGFIVVGEELAHIGRHLRDYDPRLLQALVANKVFYQVNITDYQAICSRSEDQKAANAAAAAAAAAMATTASSTSPASTPSNFLASSMSRAVLSNWALSASWFFSTLYSLAVYQVGWSDLSNLLAADQLHEQRMGVADAQSTLINQSLLAFLPNKTYLRPCEKIVQYYETRPLGDMSKLSSDSPNYYTTSCGCSGWFVHEPVPKTNLVMLIVNTTSVCRRCDAASQAQQQPPTSLLTPLGPTLPLDILTAPNKSAEEAVCVSLERDQPLYRRKLDTCFTNHPDEIQIEICGGALSSMHSLSIVLLVCGALLSSLFSTLPHKI